MNRNSLQFINKISTLISTQASSSLLELIAKAVAFDQFLWGVSFIKVTRSPHTILLNSFVQVITIKFNQALLNSAISLSELIFHECLRT